MRVMKKFTLCITLLFLLSQAAGAVEVDKKGCPSEFTVKFTQPKSMKASGTDSCRFTVKNQGSSPATGTITVSSSSQINVEINGRTQLNYSIGANESSSYTISISVPYDTPEGSYSGSVGINPGGVISFTVKVVWPDPELGALPSPVVFGKVKAGDVNTRTFKVSETMGYKAVSGVTIENPYSEELEKSGVSASVSPSTIANLEGGATSGDITLSLNVPSRGLTPGSRLNVPVFVSYGSKSFLPLTSFQFEIPFPEIDVAEKTMDVQVEEPGETKSVNVVVKETSGYTPIEGLSIKATKCYMTPIGGEREEYPGGVGWLTFEKVDYVPPGGSSNVIATISVPGGAAAASYSWEAVVTSEYAKPREVAIFFGGIVLNPSITQLINELNDMSNLSIFSVQGYEQAKTLRTTTITLLDQSQISMKEQEEILSIGNDVRTMLGAINDFYMANITEPNNTKRIYGFLKTASTAFDELNRGTAMIRSPIYAENIREIEKDAGELLDRILPSFAGFLEEEAKSYEDVDYKMAKSYYEKLSIIYYEKGDFVNGTRYKNKAIDLGNKREDAERTADAAAKDADDDIAAAEMMMWENMVLNPFDYEKVMELYAGASNNYDKSARLYALAGEYRKMENAERDLDELYAVREMVHSRTIVYFLFIAILILLIITRVILSNSAYNKDIEEVRLGDILVAPERFI